MSMPPLFHPDPECTQHPELFFPHSSGSKAALETERAKTICKRCPFRDPCKTWALANGEYGIWGGTTREDRRWIRRRQNRKQRNRYELFRLVEEMLTDDGLTLKECASKLGYSYSHVVDQRRLVLREIENGSWRP